MKPSRFTEEQVIGILREQDLSLIIDLAQSGTLRRRLENSHGDGHRTSQNGARPLCEGASIA
jgi:hypothetical protein